MGFTSLSIINKIFIFSSYKKIENWAWDYDIFTLYGGDRDDWGDPEEYDRTCVRK